MEIPPGLSPNLHGRLAIFRSLLAPLSPGRLLDLATGHGTFALAAHELGWQVTAVDVRAARLPSAPGIAWVHADVRHYSFEASAFDVIAVLGILYHLELPDQLSLLRRCVGAPTIVDTHISTSGGHEQDGYHGHLYDENRGGTEEDRRRDAMAAWDHRWSWWGTLESTERLLHDAGFRHTFRLSPPWSEDRTWWRCL